MTLSQTSTTRLPFIDWLRGAAALIMLQGHVFHSFASKDLQRDGAWVLSQFVGGIAPAIFLFLTGVTLAFGMFARDRKALGAVAKWRGTMRRAGYLLMLAVLFRVQLFVFGLPNNQWADLFKVDILNCMALSMAMVSGLAILKAQQRVRAAIAAGILIAGGSPLIAQMDWSGLHPFLRHYFVPDYNYFGFFPWGAFLAFGVAAGTILRLAKPEHLNRLMQWSALLGFGLILAGRYFADLPYSVYPKSDFWLDSPLLTVIKLGVILVGLAFAYLWTSVGSGHGFSVVRQLGTTSLLVYWVHIELVYGRWFGAFKESLTIGQCAVWSLVLIAAMTGLSLIKTNWNQIKQIPENFGYYFLAGPKRASGD